MDSPGQWLRKKVNSMVASALQKYTPYSTGSYQMYAEAPEPPYQRIYDPRWIYQIRNNHSLINNAIEEKVSQTFRRGFDEWEKQWEAKCPNCKEEFEELTRFEEQYEFTDADDIDFESERVCPECEEKVDFLTPDPATRDKAEQFFKKANAKNLNADHLQPTPESGVGQTLLDVFKELAWDIQSFDDGWLIFERSYKVDEDGRVLDFGLHGIKRAAPDRMSYVVDEETGEFGGRWWVCIECRDSDPHYSPEKKPQPCQQCGSKTYEAYAYASEDSRGNEPLYWYIRGEFVHASEYEPSRYYGYSPIVTLLDEARTSEQMDEWYREAYEQRRAPRGALIIRSSNAEATRKWNRGQLEKLNDDPNHIPTLMDDTEGTGSSEPIKFQQLLDSPADMQHMEMRDWIKNRISAKYGVTEIMMSGSPDNSGLSQSMEVQVSNRAADRLRRIFNNIILPAVLGQIGMEGWTRQVAEVEEEDEMAEAEREQRQLQIAQQASQLGLEVEWTKDNNAKVKAGEVEAGDEGLGGMLGGTGGGMSDEAGDGGSFGDAEGQNQLDGVNQAGGGPREDSRPAEDEPAFGRMTKELREGKSVEIFNDNSAEWETIEVEKEFDDGVIAQSESGKPLAIFDDGRVVMP